MLVISSEPAEGTETIEIYDVVTDKTRTEKRAAAIRKYSTKNTLNLCMRERSVITPELFALILAAILAALCLVEFFGIYRPYLRAEQAEARLEEERRQLQTLQDATADYDAQRALYLQFNCSKYSEDLAAIRADRLSILDMLERVIFPMGKVQTLNISGATCYLRMTEVKLENVAKMKVSVENEKELVEHVFVSQTGYNGDMEGAIPTVTFNITFKGGDVV